MQITIFTPSYNRGHLLDQVYESLCQQTCRDFEWVVVDDGSTDKTKDVVDKLRNENGERKDSFPIRYFHQENGGKHRAINHGAREAHGELFFILDSDDVLPPTALEDIAVQYDAIKYDHSFGGVAGMMAHGSGEVIGRGCDFDILDVTATDFRYKYKVQGDMAEVFRTEVLREFPFPEIAGERFCPEQLVWFRIAQKYKLRYFNKVVYTRDYLDGGLTSKIAKIRMQSPIASMMCYAELNGYNVPFVQKMKAAINYWRFRFCAKCLSWYWNWVSPIGFLLHCRDKSQQK